MKYETDVWYGWNGGECPVHPETVVQVQMANESREQVELECTSHAHCGRKWIWNLTIAATRIIAFRVIKEHKEPREFWLVCGGYMSYAGFALERDAHHCALVHGGKVIHVKEVL